MPIPYAQTYTATMRGRAVKVVNCEQCRAEYVYFMEREAIGQGTSVLFLDNEGASGRAASDAERSLNRMLAEDCDPVPCPACGWYQKPMVQLLRKQYRHWMLWTGGLLLIGSFVAGIVLYLNLVNIHGSNPTVTSVTVGILLFSIPVGLGLMILRRVLAANFDPNCEDLETRKQVAAEKGMLKIELERILAEEQRTAGNPGGDE
jgi:hypothetical protein